MEDGRDIRIVRGGVAEADRRAAAAEAKLRDRLVLFAEAEHKLKTGLTIVIGWASLLNTDWDTLTPENRRYGVETILRRATSMSEESDELLSSLRAEAAPAIHGQPGPWITTEGRNS